jgi:hypothetical protein
MAVRPQDFDRLAESLPLGRDPASVRRRVEAMEKLLERAFTLPVVNRPVGFDAILSLIPTVGSFVAAAMGAWIVWEARNLGLSKWHLARMGGNVGFDFLLGAIPLIGAIPDFFFQSNSRNLRILKRWLDKHHPGTRTVEGEIIGRPELPPA